eukprot:jgi/Botrbrau1/11935/Bobra.341_1s0002.1
MNDPFTSTPVESTLTVGYTVGKGRGYMPTMTRSYPGLADDFRIYLARSQERTLDKNVNLKDIYQTRALIME